MSNRLRYYFRDIFLRIFGNFSRFAPGIFILNSHFVSRLHPDYDTFCEFLAFLKKNCELIGIEDSVALIKNKKKVSDCLVSFTYDDGFKECHSIIAPALEEFKINAAFFISGGFINGNDEYRQYFSDNILGVKNKTPMNWSDIKDLNDRGHIIGSHTLDHVNMNCSDYELIDFQLRENKRLIEMCTSHPCEFFAFPYGRFKDINDFTLNIAEKYHKYIFSGTDHIHYCSLDGRVLNRRHIESEWPKSHIKFFLSARRKY